MWFILTKILNFTFLFCVHLSCCSDAINQMQISGGEKKRKFIIFNSSVALPSSTATTKSNIKSWTLDSVTVVHQPVASGQGWGCVTAGSGAKTIKTNLFSLTQVRETTAKSLTPSLSLSFVSKRRVLLLFDLLERLLYRLFSLSTTTCPKREISKTNFSTRSKFRFVSDFNVPL